MKARAQQGRAQRGASLVEAMMGLVVFTVGILGLLQANALASSQNAFAYRQSSASLIARDVIDTLERLPYSHPALTVGNHTYQSDWGATEMPMMGATASVLGTDGKLPSGKSMHDVSWVVTEKLDASGALVEARLVQINIKFNIPGANQKTVTFYTAKYNPAALVGASKNFTEI